MKKTELPPDILSFPANLVDELGVLDDDDPISVMIGNDLISVLCAMAAARLTDREAKILMMRFKDGLDRETIGYRFGVTRERIRQVEAKALRKMRGRKEARGILTQGLMAWFRQEIDKKANLIAATRIEDFKANWIADQERTRQSDTEELAKRASILTKPIEELDLSIRSYNCLKRSGVNVVGDIAKKSYNELMRVRNLGRRSLDEICQKMTELGMMLSEDESV